LIGISASYPLSNWPYTSISVGYKTGSREKSLLGSSNNTYSGQLNELSADFYLSYNEIALSLGVSILDDKNDTVSADKNKIISYYATSNFNYSDFYFSPALSITQESYYSGEYSYNTISPSVAISYQPTKSPYSASIYFYHSTYKGNDQYTDFANLYGSFALDWETKLGLDTKQKFSFKVEYSSYQDQVYSESNLSDLSVGIQWRLSRY